MSLITQPMLAPSKQFPHEETKFPALASVKLDGIRCLRINGRTLSRKFIPILNAHIQAVTSVLPDGLDGELIIERATFNQAQKAAMPEAGEPDFRLYVFDYVSSFLTETYENRIKKLEALSLPDFCVKVLPREIKDVEALYAFEKEALASGYEGLMIRDPKGPYKCGRSTTARRRADVAPRGPQRPASRSAREGSAERADAGA